MLSFVLGKFHLGVEWQSIGKYVFNILRMATLFSKVTVPLYTPTSSVSEFQFLQILTTLNRVNLFF